MKHYTYRQIMDYMEKMGIETAYDIINRMMDIIEKQTGNNPDFSDYAPEWVIKKCISYM